MKNVNKRQEEQILKKGELLFESNDFFGKNTEAEFGIL